MLVVVVGKSMSALWNAHVRYPSELLEQISG